MRALIAPALCLLLAGTAVGAETGTFQPIERAPTPGERRAAEIEYARLMELERECRQRRSRGEKVGIAIGSIAGIAAGLLIAEPGDDEEQIVASTVGAAVGATAGALIGERADPREPCKFTPPDGPVPVADPTAGDPTIPPRPGGTIGSGPEPAPGRLGN